MNGQGDPRAISIELLREIEAQALARPVLQAIAIYDCEATRESVVVLDHMASFEGVVVTFKEEAGPVVRWFFKQKPHQLWEDLLELNLEVAPINRYGCAAIMSQKTFDIMSQKTFDTYKGLLSEEQLQRTVTMILQPQVYDLNKDKKK